MFVPLLGLILGLSILLLGVLIYRGYLSLPFFPGVTKLEDNLVFLWGTVSLALAGALGIAGYWNIFRGDDLRLGRIVLGLLGLAATAGAVLETLGENNPLKRWGISQQIRSVGTLGLISYGLTFLGAVALLFIFGVAFFDYNYGGDAFMYHVPFAARLWNIITPELYTFEYFTENRFLGFPLLANWLQGLFWFVFQRIEATNLVAYVSLILLIIYLVRVVKIPFYLATLSLLAVPMIHMHAARSYIDLPGNVALAVYILTLYLLYIGQRELNRNSLILLFLGAFSAAQIKLQLMPLVFLLILATLPLLVRHYWQVGRPRLENNLRLLKVAGVVFLASLVIFSVPIKNIVLYQNPVYPIKITLAGQALNHTESSPDFMHPSLRQLAPPLRWARSVLEIDVFDQRRPWPWTLAMDFISWHEERFGLGGYFGAYVVFNLVLFALLCALNWGRETGVALIFLTVMTGVTVWMPQSYELRYYMYWMMVLVSLNAYLVCRCSEIRRGANQWLRPQYFGLVALVFVLIFVDQTDKFFTYPALQPLSQQLQQKGFLDEKILGAIQPGDKICLVNKAPMTFLYSSYFHPQHPYRLRGEFALDDQWVKDKCQGWKILR